MVNEMKSPARMKSSGPTWMSSWFELGVEQDWRDRESEKQVSEEASLN